MKTCPHCGFSLDDATRFCTECGYQFTDELFVEEAPAPEAEPVFEAPQEEPAPEAPQAEAAFFGAAAAATAVPPEYTTIHKALIKVASSKLVLLIAILLSAAILFSIAGSVMTIGNMSSFSERLQNAMNEIFTMSGLPFDSVEDAMAEFNVSLPSNIGLAGSVMTGVSSLFGNLFPILIAVGFWCIWGSARKGKLTTTGFTMIRVIEVIRMILLILAGVIVLALAVFGLVQLRGAGLPTELNRMAMGFGGGAGIFILLLFVIGIAFRGLLIRSCKTCTELVETGVYEKKVSIVAAVWLVVKGGLRVIPALLTVSMVIAIGPASLTGFLSNGCSAVALLLCGVLLFKARYTMEAAK